MRSLYDTRPRTLIDHQQLAYQALGFSVMTEHQRRYLVRWLKETLVGRPDTSTLLTQVNCWLFEHRVLIAHDRLLKRVIAEAIRSHEAHAQALANPFNKYMTIEPQPMSAPGFILSPGLETAIVDAHVDERDRMGRLMTFMARLVRFDGASGCAGGVLSGMAGATDAARAIGLSIQTALLIEGPAGSQTARRVSNPGAPGARTAYLLQPAMAPELCQAGEPLTMRGITVRKITDSLPFNFSNWANLPYTEAQIVNGSLSNFAY